MRKFIFILIVALVMSGLGGYFYFDYRFTPPENQLKVSNHQDTVAIKWVSNQDTEFAALLLPVKLEGITDTFYLQFDLGAHSTLFHKNALESIGQKYPSFISTLQDRKKPFCFNLGNLSVSVGEVKKLNYGQEIDWKPSAINIIGTLGSDILEHKVVVMDFRQHFICFNNTFPKDIPDQSVQNFEFNKRRVMLNGQINAESTQFYYDSGSSAFELITDKSKWNELAIFGAEKQTYQANSWGKSLDVHTIPSDATITLGSEIISLQEVTYIEGTSFVQNLLMYFSGMGGMIGNKLFMNKILVLDARNKKFAVR